MGEGIPLHGDRGAWDVIDFPGEHANDIDAGTLRRHLPLPGAAGGLGRSDGTDWQRVNALPLADLADYARGVIVRGGVTDYEAYSAKTDKFVLVGDGTDVVSRLLVAADLPAATQIGQVLFAVSVGPPTYELPLTSREGWLVNDEGTLLVI